MKNTDITTRAFGESIVRNIIRDGMPWFVITDVCRALEIANSRDIPKRLHQDDVDSIDVIDSMGRTQTVNVCNESGLYQIIFQSRKATAKTFTRWVTSEVLPSIRRSGFYGRAHAAFLSLIKDQIALGVSPDLAARLAGKLGGAPAAPFSSLETTAPPREEDPDMILSLMKPGLSYTVAELSALVPAAHPWKKDSAPSRHSRIGKILNRAVADQRAEKLHGRQNRYRLPSIASFPASAP